MRQQTPKKNQNINMIRILAQVFRVVLMHHLHPSQEKEPLSIQLQATGISEEVIQKSLLWFQKFFSYRPEAYEKLSSPLLRDMLVHRIYAPQEIQRIGIDGQNFLTELTLQHVLSPAKREFLMDCIMGEEIEPLTLPQLQFLTFMVLSQECRKPEEVEWLEEIVLKHESELTTLAH